MRCKLPKGSLSSPKRLVAKDMIALSSQQPMVNPSPQPHIPLPPRPKQLHQLIHRALPPHTAEILPQSTPRHDHRVHEPPVKFLLLQLQRRPARTEIVLIAIVAAAGDVLVRVVGEHDGRGPRFLHLVESRFLSLEGARGVGGDGVAVCEDGVLAEEEALEVAVFSADVLDQGHLVHGEPSWMADAV